MIDILIPTFNRSEFLRKNVLMLDEQIKNDELSDCFKIIISDNRSDDATWSILNALRENISIELEIYRQDENVGLEPNVVFLLEKAKSDYVMYLGDDDYIPEGYLKFIVKVIKEENAFCVIPGFSKLYADGTIKPERNADFDVRKYEPGFDTVCEISNYGHQLSGLVTRRESLYEEYMKEDKYRNIYPLVFFVSYCMLRGISFYAPKYQVLVNQGNSKYWKYDGSGLLIDIFRNYKIAFPDEREKLVKASLSFVKIQSWRLRAGKNPLRALIAFVQLVNSKEVDIKIKLALIWLYPELYFKNVIKVIKKEFGTSDLS